MKKIALESFYDYFDVGEITDKKRLKIFLEKYYDNLSDASLGWRIYDLKQKHYLIAKTKDLFLVLEKNKYKEFNASVDNKLTSLMKNYNKDMYNLKRRFPDAKNINLCIWDTSLLNNYTTHQTYKNYYIVEVDKERVDNLFYFLKNDMNNVFVLKKINVPDYLLENGSIVIDNLPLKSPLKNKRSFNNYFVSEPKVEKVLVDVFVYNKTILPYDISEIENIYWNIYKNHIVKTKTVLHYARIRGPKVKESVYNMLKKIGELESDK